MRAHKERLCRYESSSQIGEDVSGEHAPNESLPCLLRRQLDQLSSSEEEPEDVGPNVVADHTGMREQVPIEPMVEVEGDTKGQAEDEEQGQERPG